jgi:hypothetical protein
MVHHPPVPVLFAASSQGTRTMTLDLLDSQKERIGRLLWEHIDGVARNVMPVLNALNADPGTGIRVVSREEWDRCRARIHELQRAVAELERMALEFGRDQLPNRATPSLKR